MNQFFSMSEALNLAFHALIYLANYTDSPKKTREIAERIHVSEAHLSKVLQTLCKAGLLKAERGPRGGYLIARPLKEITLFDVYKIFKHKNFTECLFPKAICNRPEECVFRHLIKNINHLVEDTFKNITLEHLKNKIK